MSWLATVSAAVSAAGPAAPALEAELRARRPDIVRWETRPVAPDARAPEALTHARAMPEDAGDIVRVGRIGPRTPVRHADGRVRWYAVAGFKPVLVSAHVVESGAALSLADAVTAERDVIGPACEPVTLDDGRRWRATQRLAAGDALCASAVAPAPEVERDSSVTLSSERGAVSVSRVLVAASDARAGERVRLRDPSTGEILTATVTGAATARLEGR